MLRIDEVLDPLHCPAVTTLFEFIDASLQVPRYANEPFTPALATAASARKFGK